MGNIIILNLLLSEKRLINSPCQENTQTTRKLPRLQESLSIRIDFSMSSRLSVPTVLRVREKCGESNSPLPSLERLLEPFLLLKIEIQREFSRVMLSLEESSDLVF